MRAQKYAIIILALFLLSMGCTSKKQIDSTLNLVLRENPQSLDPVMSQDAIAAYAMSTIYEPLYQYNYIKRPYELEPLLAESMPSYSKDGLTVTIKIKKGVKFQDDPCFTEGKGREVTVEDFIYAFKRVADTKTKSEGFWIFDNKVVGINKWREAADYTQPIEGLVAKDKYTLQIKLTKKYPQLNYVLAMPYASPVAKEAVEKYGAEFPWHPVGTGPFVLKEFVRSSKLVYEKNKNFRGEKFPSKPVNPTKTGGGVKVSEVAIGGVQAVPVYKVSSATSKPCTDTQNQMPQGCSAQGAAALQPESEEFDYGKDLPFAEKMVVHIMIERQPMWLKFLNGELDHTDIPKDSFDNSIDKTTGELKQELRDKGIVLTKDQSSTQWWLGFNMRDPLVGKNKYLRKAIALAYDTKKDIELFGLGAAQPLNQIIPSPINGHNTKLAQREVNLELAKKMLAKAGYPGGKGLPEINFHTEGSSIHRQYAEYVKAQLEQIGVKIKINLHSRPEYFDMRKKSKHQIIKDGWIADYPDAENFLQLLYGPNASPGMNNSSFKNAEYDKLFEQVAAMAPSPERQKLINKMTEIFLEEQPWVPNWVQKIFNVRQPWLKNYVYSDFSYNVYKYYRVDPSKKVRPPNL